MTTTSKIVLGITGALAAGIVIGLLIAPEKGSELREHIKKTAGDILEKGKDILGKGKREAEEKFT